MPTIPTTTTVISSSNPSVCGEPVTFTATVAPVPPDTGIPTGTVDFIISDNGPTLTATLDGAGNASVTVPSLSAGPHVVIAFYNGDVTYFPSGSLPLIQDVTAVDTTTTVTVSPPSPLCGQPVTATVTVTAPPGAGTPTGSVTLSGVGSPQTGTLDASGQATFTVPLVVGANVLTAVFDGDDCFAPSTSLPLTVTVTPSSTTTTVVASPASPGCGQPVTLTATVAPVPPGTGTPTGTVTFTVTDNGPPVTATLVDGVASATIPSLGAGPHTVTAVYSGDGCFTGSTSTPITVTVTPSPTTTTVVASPPSPACGAPVTLTATVAPVPPGTGTPTGTVTFTVTGGGPPVTATLVGGVATATIPSLDAGAHTVTAVYDGDPCFSGSTSTPITVTVVPSATTTTVVASPVSPACGAPVTLTATVAPVPPGTGTPTGTVTFTVSGGGPPVTATLVGGVATATIPSLGAGAHTVTAVYDGDACFSGSTSTPITVTVVPSATTTTVVASPASPGCGQPVTLTATVAPVPPGTGTPTGTVVFIVSGGGPPVTATLSGGTATATIPSLSAGPHTVTAIYSGDGCFAPSISTPITVTVAASATTTTLTASPNPSTVGQTVTFTATVAPVPPGTGTPTGTVTFTISGGPTLTAPLVGGVATVTTNALTQGSHVVTATYSGDSCFTGSTSAPLTQVVNPTGGGGNTNLVASPAVIRVRTNGTFVIPTLSATLTNATTGLPIAGQTITFSANTTLGPVNLGTAVTNASGVATLTNVPVSATIVTAQQYTASFAGAPGLNPSSDTAPLVFQPTPLLP